MITVWSIGYGCVGDFWGHLRDAGVTRVIDVRANAWSKRKHWRGPELASACRSGGIAYDHLPELGNPYRGGRTRAEWQRAREQYEEHLEHPKRHQALLELVALARDARAAIMCACRAHGRCHRGVILDRLSARLSVVQLGEDAPPPKQGRLF